VAFADHEVLLSLAGHVMAALMNLKPSHGQVPDIDARVLDAATLSSFGSCRERPGNMLERIAA